MIKLIILLVIIFCLLFLPLPQAISCGLLGLVILTVEIVNESP